MLQTVLDFGGHWLINFSKRWIDLALLLYKPSGDDGILQNAPSVIWKQPSVNG
jgi:hypothetical protein